MKHIRKKLPDDVKPLTKKQSFNDEATIIDEEADIVTVYLPSCKLT